ncbi:GNAT family N-acetyltransferase [Sinimarinibacterium sp. CAU 1509]|uniref:GNAT family N-acetyltransferase n=1 Tax=Sinimarinibacterium sp. CAU 1509 TaxID=2562283 RepID=UPI0010ABFA21|nr:GNAT family N-acetyltransferase [Sinimarinibacterium sp. CAU 1509]TJY62231.1 GNAT family N-acetyltransferase [Sinimarinibacterium sp. CAU 1509]
MSLRIESLCGGQIATQLDALAQLRIVVFRDWPYLYEGSLAYESRYLQMYVSCPRSLAILVWDGDRCVGASTVLPLTDAPVDMQQPFLDAGVALGSIDYFGESVLLPAYRGRGLGVKFFELREAHARQHGLSVCAFCAVERDVDDPRKPIGYIPNDSFWQHRGYRRAPHLRTTLSWPDIGQSESTEKPMTFWMRSLEA